MGQTITRMSFFVLSMNCALVLSGCASKEPDKAKVAIEEGKEPDKAKVAIEQANNPQANKPPEAAFQPGAAVSPPLPSTERAAQKVLKLPSGYRQWAISPDGKQLANCTGQSLELWDVAAEKSTQKVLDKVEEVVKPVYSKDGKMLAVVGPDKKVLLWDLAGKKVVKSFEIQGKAINAIALSPDQSSLAVAVDRNVEVWDVSKGTRSWNLGRHTKIVTSLAFASNGTSLASGGEDSRLCLWDLKKPSPIWSIQASEGSVAHIAFSPNSELIATATYERKGKPHIWETASGKEHARLRAEFGPTGGIAFSQNGKHLFVAGRMGELQVWDAGTGELTRSEPSESLFDPLHRLDVTPDFNRLATSVDDSVRIWDPAKLVEPRTPSDKVVLTARTQLERKISYTPVVESFGTDSVRSLAFVHNNDRIVALSLPGLNRDDLIVWDVPTKKLIQKISLDSPNGRSHRAFSANGKWAAINKTLDQGIELYDLEAGKLHRTLPEEGRSDSFCFSPDGTMLAALHYLKFGEKKIVLWDLESGKARTTITKNAANAERIAFSPSGKLLALSTNKSIRLLNLATDSIVHEFPISMEVCALAFSPNGKIIAAGTKDEAERSAEITLWDVEAGSLLVALPRKGEVKSIAFGSNELMGSVHEGDEEAIVLWDLREKKAIRSMNGQRDCDFSRDGKSMAFIQQFKYGVQLASLDDLLNPTLTGALNPIVEFSGDVRPTEKGLHISLRMEGLESAATLRGLQKINVAHYLSLSPIRIVDESFAHLAGDLMLKSLTITDPSEISDAAMQHLSTLTGLEELDLSQSQVTEKAIAQLAKLENLHTLKLNSTRFSSAGLKELAQLKKLRRLELSHLHVDAKALEVLAKLPALTELAVNVADLKPADFEKFKAFPKLTGLGLSFELLGAEEMKALAALPGLTKLTFLNGMLDEKALPELKSFKSLTQMDLGKSVGPAGILGAIAAIPNLQSLRLSESTNLERLATLKALKNLQELDLFECSVTDEAIEAVAELTGLKHLRLHGENYSPNGIARLSSLKNLQTLDVDYPRIPEGVRWKLGEVLPNVKIIR